MAISICSRRPGCPGWCAGRHFTVIVPLVKLFGAVRVTGSSARCFCIVPDLCIGHNLTETSVLDRDQLSEFWLMFTIALIGVVSRRQPAAQQIR